MVDKAPPVSEFKTDLIRRKVQGISTNTKKWQRIGHQYNLARIGKFWGNSDLWPEQNRWLNQGVLL